MHAIIIHICINITKFDFQKSYVLVDIFNYSSNTLTSYVVHKNLCFEIYVKKAVRNATAFRFKIYVFFITGG